MAVDQRFQMLIDGELVDAEGGATLDSTNPATGVTLCSFPNASPSDVDRAVAAAQRAQPGWAALALNERQSVLRQVAAILRERSGELGLLDTLDTGNVYRAMRHDAAGAADVLDYFIGIALELKGEATQIDNDLHYTRHEPFGVAAKLLPFNHPIQSLGSALAAPLLTGNTLILKPSPHTSLSALSFARTVKDVFPAGVLSIVTGDNDRVAKSLIRHPDVPRLAITGSTEVGQYALREGAEHLKTITLELGGKTPLIVFDDADLDIAVDTALHGMNLGCQGHSCSSTSRALVHRSVHAEFVERLVRAFEEIRVALPVDPHADMGAITHRAQYEKILGYLESGQHEGATLLTGGARPDNPELAKGLFLTPAVFSNVERGMRIAREEIYGPVISVLCWDDEQEMLSVANDVIYGLAAVIITRDLHRAHRTARALKVGYVEINGPVSFAVGSPFGGVKRSGIGRDGNMEELLSYTQTKSVNVRMH